MFERALNASLAIIFDFEQLFVSRKVLPAKICSQTDINNRTRPYVVRLKYPVEVVTLNIIGASQE